MKVKYTLTRDEVRKIIINSPRIFESVDFDYHWGSDHMRLSGELPKEIVEGRILRDLEIEPGEHVTFDWGYYSIGDVEITVEEKK